MVFMFLKDIPTFVCLKKVVIFLIFWPTVPEGCPSFVFVSFFGLFLVAVQFM
jgi:hypothetical protein